MLFIMAVFRIESLIPYDSNIYLVVGDSAVLIDTGTGLSSGFVTEQVRKHLSGMELSAVLLTHCHADHTGGLKGILDEFRCPAYISEADYPAVAEADPKVTFADGVGIEMSPVPLRKFTPDDVFDLGIHRLSVIPTPGHTAGSVCFHDSCTFALFSGDTVFDQGYGRTDLPTGNFLQMCESLRRLRNVNIGTLYPGHGPTAADGKRAVQDAISMTEVSY